MAFEILNKAQTVIGEGKPTGDQLYFHRAEGTASGAVARDVEIAEALHEPSVLTFTIPGDHPARYWAAAKNRIEAVDGSQCLFCGQITAVEAATADEGVAVVVTAEECLSALQHTILRPFTTDLTDPAEVLALVLAQHNAENPVFSFTADPWLDQTALPVPADGYSLAEPTTTWQYLLSKFVEPYSGTGYEPWFGDGGSTGTDGSRYLIYAVAPRWSSQNVEYGKNLIDLVVSQDTERMITHLIPYGALIEQIEDAPPAYSSTQSAHGRLTLLAAYDKDYIQTYTYAPADYRWATAVFDDAKTPEDLMTAAREALPEISSMGSPANTVTATAIDLSGVDPAVDSIDIGQYATVISAPHGINQGLRCTQRHSFPLEPERNTLTLGNAAQSLTDSTASISQSLAVSADAVRLDKPIYSEGRKLTYGSGDTLVLTEFSAFFPGVITGSAKSLGLSIPISRPISALSADISGKIIIRGPSGYINGTYVSDSTAIDMAGGDGYGVAIRVRSENLQIVVTFDSAIENATNNTAVVGTPYGSITISFH